MKPYDELTARGQAIRMRRLAERALERWGLGGSRLKFIGNGENATFRVFARDAPELEPRPCYEPNQFLLRIHRQGYNEPKAIASEMTWLEALRAETNLVAPEPVRSLGGELTAECLAPGFDKPRTCTLMRWVRGRFQANKPKPVHAAALGELMAKLHGHSRSWEPPANFHRRRWDWAGLFRDSGEADFPVEEVWARIPEQLQPPLRAVSERVKERMDTLGEGPDAFGLVHSDLHLWNVLFAGGRAAAIDFDDCGFGHYAYDFAVAAGALNNHPDGRELFSALLEGYARRRPLPAEQLAHLEDFVAARRASMALWWVIRAREVQGFRNRLPIILERLSEQCARFLETGETLWRT